MKEYLEKTLRQIVTIKEIRSGYSSKELKDKLNDKYEDKSLHILFSKKFKPAKGIL